MATPDIVPMTPVQSSNVGAVGAPDGADLVVTFLAGETYIYGGAGKHAGPMISAPSAGQYLNRHIKGRFPFRKA